MRRATFFIWAVATLTIQLCTLQATAQQQDTIQSGRFFHGTGTNAGYQSYVIALDFQKGLVCGNTGGLAAGYFPYLTTTPLLYHYNATNPASLTNLGLRIPLNNPVAAFGSRVGGSPMYIGQQYRFGVYAGDVGPISFALLIRTFTKTPTNTIYNGAALIDLPYSGFAAPWLQFQTNGYTLTVTTNGLTTIIGFENVYDRWATGFPGTFTLTHFTDGTATNKIYQVELSGVTTGNFPMVATSLGQSTWSPLYTLEFEYRPPWRAVFIDQPHFTGEPVPSAYVGTTLDELLTNNTVTPAFTLPNGPTTYTNLDQSPELRRHPILDQFVTDMRRDPVALTRYVHNEIALTDGMSYNDNGSISEIAVNAGGVSRGALGTFLERQGGPAEQCALLVYLLRQAGTPAVYVYPPHNGQKLLDTQLSQMLRLQLQGAVNDKTQLYTTNKLIPVNYPWVAAYIGTNWIHIYPWMKDTELIEGLNLYDYTSSNYNNGFKWLRDFALGKTNILNFSTGDDTPLGIYEKFIQNELKNSAPGLSLDDIGYTWRNRRKSYARWEDFPKPFVSPTNSVALDTLSSTAITNVYSGMTNIFDTITIEVSSVENTNKRVTTGEIRLADVHNRRLLVRHEKTGANLHNLILSLASFRTNATGPTNFTAGDALLNSQQVSTALNSTDTNINIRVSYKRHRSLPQTVVTNRPFAYDVFPGMTVQLVVTEDRQIKKGDLAAICLDYGKVSQAMLNVHATELWNMERLLKSTPSATNTILPDLYQGGVANLMGMAYYERNGRFKEINERLQKNRVISEFAYGLASLAAKRVSGALPNSGDIILVQPKVDMNFRETVIVGNHTIHPDSGADAEQSDLNYRALQLAELSAEEHHAIDGFFQQSNSISSVKLLQLAQQRTATGGSNVLILNSQNFVAAGNVSYGGILLKNHDPALWTQTTNFLTRPTVLDLNVAFVTPGAVTNSSNSYKGMGTLWFSAYFEAAALIGGNLNGGVGPIFGDTSFTSGNAPNYSLLLDPFGDYYFGFTPPTSGNPALAPDLFAGYNTGSVANNATANNYAYSGYQTTWDLLVANYLGLNSGGSANQNFAQAIQAAYGNNGFLGWTGDGLSQYASGVSDPVHMVTGEFYINATDLALPGPMPLVVNRNYSSLNLADNQFGFGWKLDYMPYLSLNTNATVIFAAEPDGAVLAYEQTATNANVYLPTTAKNPQLNNNTSAGIGSVANRLRNRVEKQVSGPDTFYYLTNPDGSKRTFKVMTFTGSVNQTRPYLTRWEDSRGNAFTFEYGLDSSQPDYGEARRIQSSNGNYLGFYFDVYGHIIEAYTGDGRRLFYDYDQFGDLTKVTLPDASEIQYQYEHLTQLVNGKQTPYSTHLVLQEIKPDGRVVKNEYDQNRRVTNQWATVGVDLTLVRNATFIYSNNFNLTNAFTNTITGFTIIKDVNNNTNRYDYTNNLITKITDTLNQSVIQDWYEASETNKAGYYPRSLESRTDQRGLATQFNYDANGNVTNTVTTGDLTGDGTTQSATNTVAYDANNLPTLTTDPVGNKVQTLYHSQFPFLPEYVVRLAGSTPITTNKMAYGNVTNTFVSGGVTYTNMALGVLQQEIRAFGSSDAATNQWTRDGRGFITQSVRYTGTADPAMTSTFFYSDRGELMEQTDAAGRRTTSDYDALGRTTANEVFEAGQTIPVGWNYFYYNPNGELTWSDGPRFDPEDYVWRDYDGAGRSITEIHWRSQGKADGTGVEEPMGDALFATTFREYDTFGNLRRTINPRGAVTTNVWDKLGRLVQRKSYDLDGSTVLSTEGFAYEAGGLVRFHTNALGGVTDTQYTTNGLPKFRSSADGSTNAWRYYLDGRVRREIQGNGAYSETTYDDANRKTTRIFYSATGTALATNVSELDRRGNLVKRTDAGGNVFTNLFDGLDRLKTAAGPPIVTVTFNPLTGEYTTNVLQQVATNFYDAAGVMLTNVNALGEKSITTFDALGRTTRAEIRSAANQLVHETTTAYTADHHGRVITQGAGSSKIDTYEFTDNNGQEVLTALFSSTNRLEYTLHNYNVGGLLDEEVHVSNTGGSIVSEWAKTYTYDGLGRTIIQFDRDDALTLFYRDAMGNLTNRTMPGGLQWQARYNNAGQMLEEKNVGSGGVATRTNTYTYYASGNAFAGLLQTRTDGRGVTCTYTYDDYLRPATNTHTGTLPEQNLTTVWQYEARGLLTNVNEQFTSSATGPATAIRRNYDSYGQLSGETVSVGGSALYSAGQSFDASGRRSGLSLGNGYGFSWQADGLLASVSLNQFGGASYAYTTAGLLTNRTVGNRTTTISSRDGAGRPLTVTTKVNTLTKLTETLTWTGDGLLNTHTLAREDFTDSRSYFYANLSRRLTEERLNLDATKRWTNIYTFDSGTASGPGVLTKIGQAASQTTWAGVKDAFSRIGTETNTSVRQLAYGRVNGQSAVSALLDNVPQSVTLAAVDAANSQWPYQWRTTMELTPGTHRLDVSAVHPSGQFTTNQTSYFTNNIGSLTVTNISDGAGNLTQRIWRKPNGTTNLIQTLAWDARGRLYKVTERDSTQSGRDFSVVYDAFGRRLQTTEISVTNNVALTNSPTVVSHYFDPMVEFLELGVTENTKTTWKLIGPDFDGSYGGQNGTGGFEATASGFTFSPLVSDMLGNVHAVYGQSGLLWNSNRVAAYGGVPSYRPVAVGSASESLANKYAWRNRAADTIGFVWMGGNWLDPQNGRFLAFDVQGHADGSSISGYDTFGGNPMNWWDADGRDWKQFYRQSPTSAADVFGANGGNVNYRDLLTWGMQNPNARISGTDNASGWISAGQAMANGTLSNPQYINGYTDELGRSYQSFCYSCHDPNDPIAQLKLGAAFNTVNTSIPAFLAQNALAFVPAEGMIGEVGMVANTLRQTARLPLLLTEGTLESRVGTAYQNFYNEAWQQTAQRFNQGEIVIPAGQGWQTVLGRETDAAARAQLLMYLRREGISEGPGGQVLVNRRLYDPSGSGAYRIPDVSIPSAGVIFDGTIGTKTLATPQIQDFINWSGSRVNIVSPTVLPGFRPNP